MFDENIINTKSINIFESCKANIIIGSIAILIKRKEIQSETMGYTSCNINSMMALLYMVKDMMKVGVFTASPQSSVPFRPKRTAAHINGYST